MVRNGSHWFAGIWIKLYVYVILPTVVKSNLNFLNTKNNFYDKSSFNFPFGRNPGNYSVYKMRGVERLIIRAKAGPSKKQIATAP